MGKKSKARAMERAEKKRKGPGKVRVDTISLGDVGGRPVGAGSLSLFSERESGEAPSSSGKTLEAFLEEYASQIGIRKPSLGDSVPPPERERELERMLDHIHSPESVRGFAQEAVVRLQRDFPHIEFHLDDMDPRSVLEFDLAFRGLCERIPEVPKALRRVEVGIPPDMENDISRQLMEKVVPEIPLLSTLPHSEKQEVVNRFTSHFVSSKWFACVQKGTSERLYLNPNFFRNRETIQKEWRKGMKLGWHIKGVPYMGAILGHEFGHALCASLVAEELEKKKGSKPSEEEVKRGVEKLEQNLERLPENRGLLSKTAMVLGEAFPEAVVSLVYHDEKSRPKFVERIRELFPKESFLRRVFPASVQQAMAFT